MPLNTASVTPALPSGIRMQYKLALLFWMSGLLAACGGGGSDGGAAPGTAPSFVKFSAVSVPGTLTAHGYSQEAAYTYDATTQKVSSLSAVTEFASGASYEASYQSGNSPEKIVLTSAIGTKVTVDTKLGGAIIPQSGMTLYATASGEDYALMPTLTNFEWDYQNFGIWTTGGGTGKGSIGVSTVGAETPASSIPANGTATYVGMLMGHYLDSTGTPLYTVATLFATVDFGARSISFSTTGTTTIQPSTGASSYNYHLNMSSTLVAPANMNKFTGIVTSPGGGPANASMTGFAEGRFFGPAAQEIGLTFKLSRDNVIYLGALGGKQPS